MLIDLLDKVTVYEIDKEIKEKHPSGYFAPSVICSFVCPMQFFLYKFFGYVIKDLSIKQKRRLQIGSNNHLYIQGKLKKLVELNAIDNFESEVELPPNEWLIAGRLDGILTIKDKKYIVEIKTENPNFFNTKKEIPKKYKIQALLYSFLMRIPDIYILIFNNIDTYREFYFQFERMNELSFILTTIKYVLACIKDEMLPNRICKTYAEKEAKSCIYRDICTQLYKFQDLFNHFNLNKDLAFVNIDT